LKRHKFAGSENVQARGLVNVAKVRIGSLLEQEADEVNAVGLVKVLHG
jgi:hypothetical protein